MKHMESWSRLLGQFLWWNQTDLLIHQGRGRKARKAWADSAAVDPSGNVTFFREGKTRGKAMGNPSKPTAKKMRHKPSSKFLSLETSCI